MKTAPDPAHPRPDPFADLEAFDPAVDSPLDPGIRYAVLVLRRGGVETFESCEGGPGHSFPKPTIRFYGSAWAGYHAFAVAMEHGLPVFELQHVHDCYDGQLAGPCWNLVFRPEVRELPGSGDVADPELQIAAAPDLLEAARAALAEFDLGSHAASAGMYLLRAAIADAEEERS